MAIFPKIQSPCPYKNNLASVMDGDMCRMCKRQVFDLTAMRDDERMAFLKGCSGEVCVSYRLRPALAAAALAVAVVVPTAAAACQATDVEYVVVGGLKNLSAIEYVETASDRAIPKLPVVYEDTKPAQKQAPAAEDKAAPASVSLPAAF